MQFSRGQGGAVDSVRTQTGKNSLHEVQSHWRKKVQEKMQPRTPGLRMGEPWIPVMRWPYRGQPGANWQYIRKPDQEGDGGLGLTSAVFLHRILGDSCPGQILNTKSSAQEFLSKMVSVAYFDLLRSEELLEFVRCGPELQELACAIRLMSSVPLDRLS